MPKGNTKVVAPSRTEIFGLLVWTITLVLTLCLVSFSFAHPLTNWLGLVGYKIALVMQYLFGVGSFIIMLFGTILGWQLMRNHFRGNFWLKLTYFCLFLLSSCILLNLLTEIYPRLGHLNRDIIHVTYKNYLRYNLGGLPAYYLYKDLSGVNLYYLFSASGTAIIFATTFLVSLILLIDIHPFIILSSFREKFLKKNKFLKKHLSSLLAKLKNQKNVEKSKKSLLQKLKEKLFKSKQKTGKKAEDFPFEPPYTNAKVRKMVKKKTKKEEAIAKTALFPEKDNYQLPPLSLLSEAQKIDRSSLQKTLERQSQILEETFANFGIEAKVINIHCGPRIASFEVQPAIGVKVQKIKALENDIALNLKAKSIRILAPIPGKAAVGIEIPSALPQEVNFKEMLTNYRKSKQSQRIPLLLGKAISGEGVVADLTKMPHCIIAGATGSGKSVCINTIIMSILMNFSPEEVKLMLIDPKKVELMPYTNLPHMIAPVITEPRWACTALNWLVKEMEYRYEVLKQIGVRNIFDFNHRKIDFEAEANLKIKIPDKLHYLVCVIDEFADLMMVAESNIETPIARIAQMARAVGIHLILATQRPSREVITGLIKANFPVRIAFKVASRINSQIVLDTTGAESLLGNGDMLFLPPGSGHNMRAQGVFIHDQDIKKVISSICEQSPTNYLIKSFDRASFGDVSEDEVNVKKSGDSRFDDAVDLVTNTGNASTTFLQRKLKVGYARAASLMDQLEEAGIVSPPDGSRARKVLANSAVIDSE